MNISIEITSSPSTSIPFQLNMTWRAGQNECRLKSNFEFPS
jgi:hypothetical protein